LFYGGSGLSVACSLGLVYSTMKKKKEVVTKEGSDA